MKVAVVGTGYVGLVVGACLAEAGNEVICADLDAGKVAGLKQSRVPIYEPGLEPLVVSNQAEGRLSFTTDVGSAVEASDVVFIAVGTPPDEDGSADLQHVLSVARTIGDHMNQPKVVITKSTVPVGTAGRVRDAIAQRTKQVFHVCSNPEFLKEGAAVDDFMKPDRVVVGTDNPRTAELLKALYDPFTRSHQRMIIMDLRSAELTKYAANAMLATKISFMNELANLAERLGADIEQVRTGIGSDPRIGYAFIYPGIGYGGSCFPKDVKALGHTARVAGHEARILAAVEAVNEKQKRVLFRKIESFFGGKLAGRIIAIWGLSFKPNTDDLREAPSRVLMESLWKAGARVRAYDPVALAETRRIYGEREGLALCDSAAAALDGADALAICTEWQEFRSPDFARIKATLKQPVIFDGRNLYEPALLSQQGIRYFAIGRGERLPA